MIKKSIIVFLSFMLFISIVYDFSQKLRGDQWENNANQVLSAYSDLNSKYISLSKDYVLCVHKQLKQTEE